jgi:Outer membrane lipoprotein-sorting protein
VNLPSPVKFLFPIGLTFALLSLSLPAQEPATPAMSAQELAGRIDTTLQGNALIRSQMELRFSNGGKRVLQLQIKQRRTKTAGDLAYRVLWPNEYKEQVVILHQESGKAPAGSVILPHQPVRTLDSAHMNEGLFESDLSYQDAIENVYSWKEQGIVGTETINGVNCQILESKPADSSVSIYARVRSWIDPRRLVPLRIEKYSASGELLRRIDVNRVARDEKHKPIPAGLTVRTPGKNTTTEFNGARIDQDVNLTDQDFTAAGAVR